MTRRDTPEYAAHRAAHTTDDPAVDRARSAVQLARAQVHETRRRFMRREIGRADVTAAEHALSRALDELDRVNGGTTWR